MLLNSSQTSRFVFGEVLPAVAVKKLRPYQITHLLNIVSKHCVSSRRFAASLTDERAL